MGTRADFYVGRGPNAEWLGSIAWDGYPEGIEKALLKAADEKDFRAELRKFFSGREDVTLPTMGWPWPWDDSRTTDYAYAFDGHVWGSCFGTGWWDARRKQPEEPKGKPPDFPNMKSRQKVTLGKRSGVMIIGG